MAVAKGETAGLRAPSRGGRVEGIGRATVTRIQAGRTEDVEDTLVLEREISISVNGERAVLTSCSPGHERELVYGFLFSEGFIGSVDEVASIESKGDEFFVEVEGGRHPTVDRFPPRVESPLTLPAGRLLDAGRECRERGAIFRKTGGTHAASLGDVSRSVNFFEDVSRTCALEKAMGDALLGGTDFGDTFIFLSSRVSLRMVLKAARCGIPIFASVSAPTLQAVEAVRTLNLCLCCFVRGERLVIYSHKWRVER